MKKISMGEIRRMYAELQPGGCWFEPDTMRFFKTELPQYGYQCRAGILFVTSEVCPSSKKRYTVRRMAADGDINTIGDFHWHASAREAAAAMRLYARTADS